jgi:tetratricopeptide (TPR) repeat protein
MGAWQRLHFVSAFAAVAVVLAVSSAAAQSKQQLELCENIRSDYSPDLAIKACSAIIRSVKGLKRGPEMIALILLFRGREYDEKKDYDHAIADYTESLNLGSPKDDIVFRGRGRDYLLKGDYDRAIADETQAIKLDPTVALPYDFRGAAYLGKSDFDRAIADFSQAIQLKPDDSFALRSRGYAYSQKHDFDRASADYTQAIALEPKDASLFAARCRANALKASVLFLTNGLKDALTSAIADCSRAIQLDPNSADAFYVRGLLERVLGDQTAGDQDIARAKSIDPNIGK